MHQSNPKSQDSAQGWLSDKRWAIMQGDAWGEAEFGDTETVPEYSPT